MSRRAEWWLSVLAGIWPITWRSARATKWPVVGKLVARCAFPLMSEKNFNVTHIPINKKISGIDNICLPEIVLERLIRESAHRVAIKRCTCRDERQCSNHPVTYGCLQLGLGAAEIDPRIARHLTKDEAVAHMKKCIQNGLIPMIGRVRVDDLIWGVRNQGRLLAVCFCCHCCCTIFNSGKYLPESVGRGMVRLSGLSVRVDHDRCRQCKGCTAACFMENIEIRENRVRIGPDCKGCGRCVAQCPNNALKIVIEDMEAAMSELTHRISSRVDIT